MPSDAIPFICDSPHSGTLYPPDFGYALPLERLRGGEDTHVDALWAHVPEVGGTLIAATFPRTYVDANRSALDIDVALLDAPWTGHIEPSTAALRGKGVVWRQLRDGVPIYERKLSVAEVQHRIDKYWAPYHAVLRQTAREAVVRWGRYWHLNLHSMPSDSYALLGIRPTRPLADFVLGDLHGESCSGEFVAVVKEAIEDCGYSVAVNDPWPGHELVQIMGSRSEQRHSLQVEIARPLYMDEATREPNANFRCLQLDIARMLRVIGAYMRDQLRLSV